VRLQNKSETDGVEAVKSELESSKVSLWEAKVRTQRQ